MEYLIVYIFGAVALTFAYTLFRKLVASNRATFIDNFEFPVTLKHKVLEKYPHLNENQLEHVIHGLREYFHLCNLAGRRMVSMPSQVVDAAWHEFILFTREYQRFCRNSLGRFLHHTPAEAMTSPTKAQAGIKTAWKTSCFRESIQPKSAHRLPILFEIDSKLNIPDGFNYDLNCLGSEDHKYCASHIGCGSGCGGDSGCGGGCGGD